MIHPCKINKRHLSIGTIFFYVYLPETKGKTLQEIEDYFSGRITSLNSKKIDNQLLNNNTTKSLMEQDKLLSVNEKK